ncbi:MAG: tetratricopeptide repeat protein [Candidatus Eremiobacteraeota bacterium]|nr:tetratricopeptide repeat protein [Candidatus Eremiobacteraeota bacterium]
MKQKTKARTSSVVIEEGEPLENSVIWSWMRNYYSEGGVAVWNDGDVPFHITNTPLLAREWSKSVLALLRDFARQGLLHPDQPVEVFELGPGTGRHAFFLWQELGRLKNLTEALFEKPLQFRLHLAELGRSGLTSLAEHPNLQKPLAAGEIVLHQFDIETDSRPTLFQPSSASLSLPSENPVFIIANYILDSLSHDVLKVEDGELFRGHTKLSVKGLREGVDPVKMKDLGERIKLTFQYGKEPVTYAEPLWNAVAEHYRRVRGETYIPFPTSSMRLAQRSREWSKCATCFLVADKSFTTLEQMVELEEPELVPHGGGFSFNANLHAFGVMAFELGGRAFHTTTRDGTMELSHVIFPAPGTNADWQLAETQYRCSDLESFNAIDRFRVKESVDDQVPKCKLRLCLDLLRLTGFDPQVFYELSDDILAGLLEEHEDYDEMEDELIRSLPRCLDLIYPLSDDVDVAFEIGRVAYRLDRYAEAHRAFVLSIEHYGEDPRSRFNTGLCWYYRDQFEKARAEFELALEQDPHYKDAKTWIAKCDKRTR